MLDLRSTSPSLLLSASLLLALSAGCKGDDGGNEGADSETADEAGGEPLEPGVVELHVDSHGVHHFVGASDPSVLWASGYVQAETRLVQMLLLRRRALGRQAEVLGFDKRDQDRLSRIFDFARLGARDMERLAQEHPEDFALIEAWIAGVNAYIEAVNSGAVETPLGLGPDDLDLAPEPWTTADVGAIAKLLMFGNSNSLEYEILTTVLFRIDPSLFQDLTLPLPAYPVFTVPPEHVPNGLPPSSGPGLLGPGALPPAPDVDPAPTIEGLERLHEVLDEFSVDGSNAWVIAGSNTASGRPMLANDPHQPLTSPALVYAEHLDSKSRGAGSFNAAGFAFAGTPGVQLGHNEAVAWGATTGTADVMDMWSVATDPDAQTVDVGGQTLDYEPREEVIAIAGGEDEVLIIDEVPGYGVLLGDALLEGLGINEAFVAGTDRRLLLNWTGFEAGNELHAFFQMGRSADADAFQAAAEQMEVGTFNWMFADAESIGYRSRILVPDRGDPGTMPTPWLMLDGDDPSGLWSGAFLADALTPQSRDPSQGYLLSSNNEPFGFTADGDITNDPFYWGTFFLPGFRAKRADDQLAAIFSAGPMTVADMQALQTDTYSTEADMLVPLLSAAWAEVGSDPALAAYEGREDLANLVAELEAWDRHFARESSASVAFYVFAHELARVSVGDEMSLVFEAILTAAPAFALKFSALTVTEAYPGSPALIDSSVAELALAALDATIAWMDQNAGGSSTAGLRWDEFHITEFASPVESLTWGQVGSAGSVCILNQATAKYLTPAGEVADRFISTDGSMFRSVIEFGEDGRPRMHFNFAPGNGGAPGGPNWGDAVEDWAAGTYVDMPFTLAEIEAASDEVRIIEVPEAYH
ncbi:probable penicillin amidase [Plesiocystis pacifica SIR-1]|uniref:Probable penicillin amidase n=1 Tax=Plesiocystis pacifica SIR-1 TaxID=391625 RepID=A6GGS7_9BACT|nr:penicillin acylase family protein [Plesiocystis pacifica]EDM74924.1 probable penicillin amidase [Plesiocystis pacifica SIR-1]